MYMYNSFSLHSVHVEPYRFSRTVNTCLRQSYSTCLIIRMRNIRVLLSEMLSMFTPQYLQLTLYLV